MPTIAQDADATYLDTDSPKTVTLGSAVTAGRSLLLAIAVYNYAAWGDVTDNLGNTWLRQIEHGSDAESGIAFYLVPATVAGSVTVTYTPSTPQFVSMYLAELSGSVVVASLADEFGTSTSPQAPNRNTTADGCLAIGALSNNGGDASIAPASGWTEVCAIDLPNAVTTTLSVITQTITTVGAAAPSWTQSGSNPVWCAGIVLADVQPTQAPGWCQRTNAGTSATGTTSLTITKPTGTVDGDILICTLAHKGSSWATMPAGWTVVGRVLAGSTRTEMHWKRANSEGASYSITGLATAAAGCMQAYGGGLNGGNVVNVVASATEASTGSAVCPSAFVSVPRALIVSAIGVGSNQVVSRVTARTAVTGDTPPDPNIWSLRVRANGRTTGISSALCDAQKTATGETGEIVGQQLLAQFTAENGIIVAALLPEYQSVGGFTRYYLASKYPADRIEGGLDGGWDADYSDPTDTDVTITPLRLSQTRSDAGRIGALEVVSNVPNSTTCTYYGYTRPLEAQTISGTVNLCSLANAYFEDRTLGQIAANAYWRIHVYISVGQTTGVRHTLLDEYLDGTAFATPYSIVAQALTSPQALTSGAAQAGDSVVVEIGIGVGTFATPTPLRPPQDFVAAYYTFGAQDWSGVSESDARVAFGPAWPDAVPASAIGSTLNQTPFVDFSHTFVEQAPTPNANTNTTQATAAVIASLPFQSAVLDTTTVGTPDAALWWQWTATFTGQVVVNAFESAYPIRIGIEEDSGDPAPDIVQTNTNMASSGMSAAYTTFEAVTGRTYFFRVAANGLSAGPSAGGVLRVGAFRVLPPANDDVLVPIGTVGIVRYRATQMVDVGAPTALTSVPLSGIALDTSGRPMASLNGGMHTGPRIYVGRFPSGPVEILDLDTLNKGEFEIDFISAPIDTYPSNDWETGGMGSLSNLALTSDGTLAIGWWGNGFTRVATVKAVGSLLEGSYFIDAATTNSWSVATLPAGHADNQPGAPFAAATRSVVAQDTAGAGWIALNADASRVYYTCGGNYFSLGSQAVKAFDLTNNVQLPDVGSIAPSGSIAPDARGLCLLPDGGWLVANGGNVVRLSSLGLVTQTYTTTDPALGQTLCDVRLSADETAFYAWDFDTHSLFKFDLSSGTELYGFRTYLGTGSAVQMAVYVTQPPSPEFSIRTVQQRRLRRAPHLSAEQKWLWYQRLQLDMQTGVGLVDGQGEDPQVMLRWSDDGGHTWSNEAWESAGRLGATRTRVIWRRLGRARTRTFEVVVSDPVPWKLAAAYLDVEPGNGS